jgi:anti-sigma B factor antagonist
VLSVIERVVGDVTILQMSGRLVLYEGDSILRQTVDDLVRQGRTKVLIDLGGVNYIDSAGIGMLIAKYLSVRRKGGDLKLLHLNTRGLLVLTITRLLNVFETFETEDAALRSFAS